MPGPASLGRFVLHAFLWLPPCFAAWYWSAPYHSAVAGALARFIVSTFNPGLVTAIERSGTDLVFVTSIRVSPAPGQVALLLPEVNPLLYTFGLPFFLALMLAARARWWAILAGAVALLPFQGWGIAFDLLVQLAARLGPDVAAQARLLGWQREAIALGYQLGSLVFPTLVPIILWGVFNRGFIAACSRIPTRIAG